MRIEIEVKFSLDVEPDDRLASQLYRLVDDLETEPREALQELATRMPLEDWSINEFHSNACDAGMIPCQCGVLR
jgi:hypothetical protein